MVNFSEQITGLDTLGTQLGDFMSNLAPGLLTFILVMGVGGAIIGIILAVAFVIRKYVTK